jgi:hypothetical protein
MDRSTLDQTIEPQGENVLNKIINNGGKSVLSAFLLQPFAWQFDTFPKNSNDPIYNIKKYFTEKARNTAPCYVLHELLLEEDQGYLLIGVGLQNEHDSEPLTKTAFLFHYKELSDPHSLSNLDFYDILDDGQRKLLNVRQMRTRLKEMEDEIDFHVYARGASDYKRFYDELAAFHITKEEITEIMLRFNSKETNVATLFISKKITTSAKLMDEWVIPYCNKKCHKDNSDFLDDVIESLTNYTIDKKNNAKELKMCNEFSSFLERWKDFEQAAQDYLYEGERYGKLQGQMRWLKDRFVHILTIMKADIMTLQGDEKKLKELLSDHEYNQMSYEIVTGTRELENLEKEYEQAKEVVAQIEKAQEEISRRILLLEARGEYDEWQKYTSEMETLQAKMNPELQKRFEDEAKDIEYTLHVVCKDEIETARKHLTNLEEKLTQAVTEKAELEKELLLLEREGNRLYGEKGAVEREMETLHADASEYCLRNGIDINLVIHISNPVARSIMDEEQNRLDTRRDDLLQKIAQKEEEVSNLSLRLEQLQKEESQAFISVNDRERDSREARTVYEDYAARQEAIFSAAATLSVSNGDLLRTESILTKLAKDTGSEIESKLKGQQEIKRMLAFYQGGTDTSNSLLENVLRENGIDFLRGSDYLQKRLTDCEELFSRIPFLPYAIIVSEKAYRAVSKLRIEEHTHNLFPVLIQERLSTYNFTVSGSMYSINEELALFGGYDERFVQKEYITNKIAEYMGKDSELEEGIQLLRNRLSQMESILLDIKLLANRYPEETLKTLEDKLSESEVNLQSSRTHLLETQERIVLTKTQITSVQEAIQGLKELLTTINRDIEDYDRCKRLLESYEKKEMQLDRICEDMERNSQARENVRESKASILEQEKVSERQQNEIRSAITMTEHDYGQYINEEYEGTFLVDANGLSYQKEILHERLQRILGSEEYRELSSIKKRLSEVSKKVIEKQRDFTQMGVSEEELKGVQYDKSRLHELRGNEKENANRKALQSQEVGRKENNVTTKKAGLDRARTQCQLTYGKPYNTEALYQDYNALISNTKKDIKTISSKLYDSLELEKEIKTVMEEWNYEESSVKPIPLTEEVHPENCREIKRRVMRELNECMESRKNHNRNMNNLIRECSMKYVQKRGNEKIGELLSKVEEAMKLENLTGDKLANMRSQITAFINFYADKVKMLEKTYSIILGELLPKLRNILEEVRTIDRYSFMNGVKLVELRKVATAGNEDAIKEDLETAVMAAEKRESRDDIYNELKRKIILPRLMNIYAGTHSIEIKVMKYEYTTKAVQFLTPFEQSHDGDGASGAQALICVFEILLMLTRYMKSESPNARSTQYSSFFIIDNPFGSITTNHFVYKLFEILEYFKVQLFTFSDLSEVSIHHLNKHIYSYKFVKSGEQQVLIPQHSKGEGIPQELLKGYSFEEEQLSIDFEILR